MNIWLDLLQIAIHSPSPHNVQPWRIKIVNESEAELYIDSTRTLPKEDVTGSFIISTMGMFIEALDILAGQRDLRIQYELFRKPESIAPAILKAETATLIPFARLKLDPDGRSENVYNEDLFLKRRTSRLHLKKKKPSDESIQALKRIGSEWQQEFTIISDRERIERILKLNTDALFDDLNSPNYHDEIVEWFRYTNKQSLHHRDGLDARCMNTSPINYWIVANMPKLLLLPVARQIMARVYRKQIGEVPVLGLISGKFWKPADSIDAGRFLMRFWLETARQDLYIHPYGNLVTNRETASAVEKELAVKDIWLIFKIGYSDEPPKSHRLPLEKVLLD